MNGQEFSDKAPVPPDSPRRDILKGGIKWLTAIVAGAFGYPLLRFIGFRVKPKPRLITVNKALAPGASHIEHDFILFMLEKGPVAVSRTCTHLGCRLNYRPESALLECPCHQSRFSLEGGLINGPAKRDLPVFPVSVKRDDQDEIVGYVVTL